MGFKCNSPGDTSRTKIEIINEKGKPAGIGINTRVENEMREYSNKYAWNKYARAGLDGLTLLWYYTKLNYRITIDSGRIKNENKKIKDDTFQGTEITNFSYHKKKKKVWISN